jgi:hypothetical protein
MLSPSLARPWSPIIELHTRPDCRDEGLLARNPHPGTVDGHSHRLLVGFTVTLIVISRSCISIPHRLTSHLHEQRLSVQACLVSGLLLTGTLYLIKAEEIPRSVVLLTIGLLTVSLSARRFVFRALLYQRFERGMNTRNVIIVGTGAEAHALRHHLQSIRQLGYNFKGFVHVPGVDTQLAGTTGDVLGRSTASSTTPANTSSTRFSSPRPASAASSRTSSTRLAPTASICASCPTCTTAWPGTAPSNTSASFPTIPLHRGHVPEVGLILKRLLDITLATMALHVFSPILLAIAIAVKLDSPGPIFYASERIGKKARVFKCIKFRTMVRDADRRRAEIMHMNERQGILFKITQRPAHHQGRPHPAQVLARRAAPVL